jgi:hypothetical protein
MKKEHSEEFVVLYYNFIGCNHGYKDIKIKKVKASTEGNIQ